MRIFITDRENKEHELVAEEGRRMMEIIRDAGLPVKAECGGCCACATCHVYVLEDWFTKLTEADEEELDMLDMAFDVRDQSRLSCQIIMSDALDGFKATLAPDYD